MITQINVFSTKDLLLFRLRYSLFHSAYFDGFLDSPGHSEGKNEFGGSSYKIMCSLFEIPEIFGLIFDELDSASAIMLMWTCKAAHTLGKKSVAKCPFAYSNEVLYATTHGRINQLVEMSNWSNALLNPGNIAWKIQAGVECEYSKVLQLYIANGAVLSPHWKEKLPNF